MFERKKSRVAPKPSALGIKEKEESTSKTCDCSAEGGVLIAQKSLASYQARAIGNVVLSVCIVVFTSCRCCFVVCVLCWASLQNVKAAFSLLYLFGIACAFGLASTRRGCWR